MYEEGLYHEWIAVNEFHSLDKIGWNQIPTAYVKHHYYKLHL
jgi:hypothetical protein